MLLRHLSSVQMRLFEMCSNKNGESNDASENEGYEKEISKMMHGFGDAAEPSPATVKLVETIVLDQLRKILRLAADVAERRGKSTIHPEDVVFLMRRNTPKLRRLLHHLKMKAEIKSKSKYLGTEPEDEVEDKAAIRAYKEAVELLDDFTGEDVEPDRTMRERKMRANGISQRLSAEKYEAYHKARCVSFRCGPKKRFRRWMCPRGDSDASDQTIELMRYLAFETVAQIVDLSLIVRRDSRGSAGPFVKLEGDYCNPATFDDSTLDASGGADAITVGHVREAMRRFFAPRVGTEGMFSRNVKSDPPARFLAL